MYKLGLRSGKQKGEIKMIDMREVTRWGVEARALAAERKRREQARQHITYGNTTVTVKKDADFKFSEFFKG